MNKTFIINGNGGSGKDTFIDLLRQCAKANNCEDSIISVSSVDEIKKIAKENFGWDGEDKSDKWRKILSDLKIIQTESCNGPFEYMANQRKLNKNNIMFFHIREPSEIQKFKGLTGARTVLIERDTTLNKKYGNIADDGINDFKYDIIVYNSDFKIFKSLASKFYDLYIKDLL